MTFGSGSLTESDFLKFPFCVCAFHAGVDKAIIKLADLEKHVILHYILYIRTNDRIYCTP